MRFRQSSGYGCTSVAEKVTVLLTPPVSKSLRQYRPASTFVLMSGSAAGIAGTICVSVQPLAPLCGMPIPSVIGTVVGARDASVTVTVPDCVAWNERDTDPGTGRMPVQAAVVGAAGVGVEGVVGVSLLLPQPATATPRQTHTMAAKTLMMVRDARCER
jgi:hypothetical protein